jgi:glycosyltransferase involved in cell wall biosynthesis
MRTGSAVLERLRGCPSVTGSPKSFRGYGEVGVSAVQGYSAPCQNMKPLRILVLAAYLPALGAHGGANRMYYNLRILASRHRVTLISFIESEGEREQLRQLEDFGVEAKAVLRRAERTGDLWMPKPREHWEFASRELHALVCQTLAEHPFDVVQAEFLQMAQHVPKELPLLKVLNEQEITYDNLYLNYKQEAGWWRKAQRLYEWLVQLNYEVRVCRQFDRIACMTDEDRTSLSRFVSPERLRTVPIGVDSEYFDPQSIEGHDDDVLRMLFVGNYRHTPNRDAVHFFVKRILPSIHQEVPNAQFWVVGGNAQMLDQKLLQASNSVQVAGYVNDVRSAYGKSAVFVAPILTGTGMRVKLLEALSMGMAVAATPLAAQGFHCEAGDALLVADTPERFVAATVRLLKDLKLRKTLGKNARRMIQEKYDWKVIARQFLDLVEVQNA